MIEGNEMLVSWTIVLARDLLETGPNQSRVHLFPACVSARSLCYFVVCTVDFDAGNARQRRWLYTSSALWGCEDS